MDKITFCYFTFCNNQQHTLELVVEHFYGYDVVANTPIEASLFIYNGTKYTSSKLKYYG